MTVLEHQLISINLKVNSLTSLLNDNKPHASAHLISKYVGDILRRHNG